MPDRFDPYKVLQVDSRGRGRGHPGGVPAACPQIPPGPGRDARGGRADGRDQRGVGADRRRRRAARPTTGGAGPGLPRATPQRPSRARRPPTRRVDRAARASSRDRAAASGPTAAARGRLARLDVGRSTQGGGFDESMRAAEGFGAAGPPPGRPSGTVLNFGRYAGWSLGEVARHDIEYIEWLDRAPDRPELPRRARRDPALGAAGGDRPTREDADRRGLYRRR